MYTTNTNENARFSDLFRAAAILNDPNAEAVRRSATARAEAAEKRLDAKAAEKCYDTARDEAKKAAKEAARLRRLVAADKSRALSRAYQIAERSALELAIDENIANRHYKEAAKAAARATERQEEAEAREAAHGAALSRRYYAFITTPEKEAADKAAKQARQSARIAERSEAAARAAKARAARLATARDLDISTKEAAADIAAEKEAAAADRRAIADTLAAEAARLSADPAAVTIAYHIPAAALMEKGNPHEIAEQFANRNLLHFTAAKIYIIPDLSLIPDKYESREAKAAEAIRAARTAIIGYEAPEAIARQSAKARSRTEASPLAFALRREAESRDHLAADLADIESAAREAITAASFGSEDTANRLEAKAAAIRGAEEARPKNERNANAIRTAADLEREAAAIRERLADPAAPFWMLTARRAAFLAINNYYAASRHEAAQGMEHLTAEALTAPEKAAADPMEAAVLIADPSQTLEADEEAEAEAANRAAIREAAEKLAATLSPIRAAILNDLITGYSPAQIAARKNRTRGTICEHIAAIRAVFAALLSENPALQSAARFSAYLCDGNAAAVITTEARRADKAATQARKIAAASAFAEAAEAEEITAACLATLSPIRRRLLYAVREAGSIRAAADLIGRNEATLREHIAAIRRAIFTALTAAKLEEAAEAVKTADFAILAACLCGTLDKA